MNILFICTGNIFRSMSAQYCLQKYLKDNNIIDINVSSAGISPCSLGKTDPKVLETLKEFNIDASKHIPQKLTKELINNNDLIIAMSTNHFNYIKENFNLKVPYFNEIAYNKKEPIKDNCEIYGVYKGHEKEYIQYDIKIVNYIHNSIPNFVNNINKFLTTKNNIS